jgi:hypothetical protein
MEDDKMTKWEYYGMSGLDRGPIHKGINELGADGWDLVSVENGIGYFKRPIPDSTEVFRGSAFVEVEHHQ